MPRGKSTRGAHSESTKMDTDGTGNWLHCVMFGISNIIIADLSVIHLLITIYMYDIC